MKKIIASLLLITMLISIVPMTVLAGETFEPSDSVLVSFDTKGGSSVESQSVTVGTSAIKPVNPQKEGFLFAGWSLNGQAYDFQTKVTSSITLEATWQENTLPKSYLDIEMLQITPSYLEMWNGMTLELNCSTTGHVTRSDGYKYTRYFAFKPSMEFYSLDSSIVSVDNMGNVTAKSLGTTYVWAKVKTETTRTFESGTVTIPANSYLKPIEVVVTEKPSYYKLFESSPETQKITISSNSQTNASTFTAIPSTFGSAVVSIWYDDQKNVFTMTCDDNLLGDFANWNAILEQTGVPTTFIAPTLSDYISADYWKYEVYLGNMVQSHSHYHDSSAEYSRSERTSAQDWADEYYGRKDIEGAGIPSLVIGYPCGYNNATYSKMLYIAGRGTGSGINTFGNTEYNCLASNSGFGATQAAIDGGYRTSVGSWGCVHYHSMGKDFEKILDNFTKLKELSSEGYVWATTFVRAAQYGQERDTATVTVLEKDQAKGLVRFQVTDKMNDELFFQPLSIKIGVDSTWTKARAYQNGEVVRTQVKTENGKTYVIVDAVPDKGEVTLVKADCTVSQTENEIHITPADSSVVPQKEMTVTLPVDLDVWNYRVAYQNEELLKTSIQTVAGVSTLSVTFDISKGDVVVTPNLGENETTHTMTQVYNHEVKPSSSIPITISTKEELVLLSKYQNEWNPVLKEGEVSKNPTEGLIFELESDLDLSSIPSFEPIGWMVYAENNSAFNFKVPFMGTFHGNRHTIYGLNIHKGSGATGLFGIANGANISDLSIEGNISGVKYVGSVVGNLQNSSVSNVTFKGTITSEANGSERNGGSFVGGIAGLVSGSTIKNCVVLDTSISVYAAPKISVLKNSYDGFGSTTTAFFSGSGVGGIAGNLDSKAKERSTIENCEFVGNISAYDYEGEGAEEIGGIVGHLANCVVTSCFAKANISGKSIVGGLAGSMTGGQTSQVLNSSFYGTLKGKTVVGGVAGYIGTSSYQVIKNCYVNVTSIDATGDFGLVVGQAAYGSNKPSITSVFYTPKESITVGTIQSGLDIQATASSEADALTSLNSVATTNKYQDWSISDEGQILCVHLPIFKVSFVDNEGTLIENQYVGNGLNSTPPVAPWKLGYLFREWSGTTTNIKEDTLVTAIYDTIDVVTVTFQDIDGTVLSTQQINKGDTAVAPKTPYHNGFVFSSWNQSFENVQEDIMIQATYVKGYIVSFYGMNGALVEKQEVAEGSSAISPKIPSIEGYHFVSYSTSFENVQANLDVQIQYEKNSSEGLSIKTYGLHGSGLTGSSITSAALTALIDSSDGADIILLSGIKSISIPEDSLYGGYQYTTTRGSSGGLGFAVLYRKAKFKLDTSIAVYENPQVKWTDNGALAVPLTEVETGKSVVAFVMYYGGNSKTQTGGNLENSVKAFLDAMRSSFPSTTNYVGFIRCTSLEKNGGGVGKKDAFNSVASYVEDFTWNCSIEVDAADGITGDYFCTFVKTSEVAKTTSGEDTPTSPLTSKAISSTTEITKAASSGKEQFVVSFLNPDKTLIEVQYVEEGASATLPNVEEKKDGQTFIEWSGDYTNITSNRAITAVYDYVYTITFVDNLGNTIDTKVVRAGSSLNIPTAPKVNEYKFVSWDATTLENIQADQTVTATYVYNMVNVVFKDNLGNTIVTKKVEKGTDVVYPTAPAVYGYKFESWSIPSISNIQEDKEVVANYVYNLVKVTFKDLNGNILNESDVEKGGTIPSYQARAKAGYVFDGWTKDGELFTSKTPVTENMTLTPIFKLQISLLDTKLTELATANTLSERKQIIKDVEAVLALWTNEEVAELNLSAYESAKTAYDAVIQSANEDLTKASSATNTVLVVVLSTVSVWSLGVLSILVKRWF